MKRSHHLAELLGSEPAFRQKVLESTNFTFKSKTKLDLGELKPQNRQLTLREKQLGNFKMNRRKRVQPERASGQAAGADGRRSRNQPLQDASRSGTAQRVLELKRQQLRLQLTDPALQLQAAVTNSFTGSLDPTYRGAQEPEQPSQSLLRQREVSPSAKEVTRFKSSMMPYQKGGAQKRMRPQTGVYRKQDRLKSPRNEEAANQTAKHTPRLDARGKNLVNIQTESGFLPRQQDSSVNLYQSLRKSIKAIENNSRQTQQDLKELMLTDSYALILEQKRESKRLQTQLQKIRGSAISKDSLPGSRRLVAANRSDRNTMISITQTAAGAASSQQIWTKQQDAVFSQDESAEPTSISGKAGVSLRDSQSVHTSAHPMPRGGTLNHLSPMTYSGQPPKLGAFARTAWAPSGLASAGGAGATTKARSPNKSEGHPKLLANMRQAAIATQRDQVASIRGLHDHQLVREAASLSSRQLLERKSRTGRHTSAQRYNQARDQSMAVMQFSFNKQASAQAGVFGKQPRTGRQNSANRYGRARDQAQAPGFGEARAERPKTCKNWRRTNMNLAVDSAPALDLVRGSNTFNLMSAKNPRLQVVATPGSNGMDGDVKQHSPVESARSSSASREQVASFRNVPRLPRASQMSNFVVESMQNHRRISSKGAVLKASQNESLQERPESGLNQVVKAKMTVTKSSFNRNRSSYGADAIDIYKIKSQCTKFAINEKQRRRSKPVRILGRHRPYTRQTTGEVSHKVRPAEETPARPRSPHRKKEEVEETLRVPELQEESKTLEVHEEAAQLQTFGVKQKQGQTLQVPRSKRSLERDASHLLPPQGSHSGIFNTDSFSQASKDSSTRHFALTKLTRLKQAEVAEYQDKVANLLVYEKRQEDKVRMRKKARARQDRQLVQSQNMSLRVKIDPKYEFSPAQLRTLSQRIKLDNMRGSKSADGVRLGRSPHHFNFQTTKSIGLILEHDPHKLEGLRQQSEIANLSRQLQRYCYVNLKKARLDDAKIEEILNYNLNLELEAAYNTDTNRGRKLFKKLVSQIRADNLQQVFQTLELPEEADAYSLDPSCFTLLPNFHWYHMNIVADHSPLSLVAVPFFNFAVARSIGLYYFHVDKATVSDSAESLRFANTLQQSNWFFSKTEQIDQVLKVHVVKANVDAAMRTLSLGLEEFNFALPFLFNIALFKAMNGHLIEALLIFKKLYRLRPSSKEVKHNLIYLSLLGEWFNDVQREFGLDTTLTPDMQQMVDYAKEFHRRQHGLGQKRLSGGLQFERSQRRSLSAGIEQLVLPGKRAHMRPHKSDLNGLVSPALSDCCEEQRSQVHVHENFLNRHRSHNFIHDRNRVIEFNRTTKRIDEANDFELQERLRQEKMQRTLGENVLHSPHRMQAQFQHPERGKILYKKFKYNQIGRGINYRSLTLKRRAWSEFRVQRICRQGLDVDEEAEETRALREKVQLQRELEAQTKQENYEMFLRITEQYKRSIHREASKADRGSTGSSVHSSASFLDDDSDDSVQLSPTRSIDATKPRKLITLMEKLGDDGVPRTEGNIKLDEVYVDLIRLQRGHLTHQDVDKVNHEYKNMLEGLRQLNNLVKIKYFVQMYHFRKKKELTDKEQSGKTNTLDFRKEMDQNPTDILFQQIDRFPKVRQAKCMITTLLLERTKGEQKRITKVLQFVADNAQRAYNLTDRDAVQNEASTEIKKLIQALVDGIGIKYQRAIEVLSREDLNDYDKGVEREKIQKSVETDAYYVKRLNRILHKVAEQAKIQADLNLTKQQRRKQINRLEHEAYLADVGIEDATSRKRTRLEGFFELRDGARDEAGQCSGDHDEEASEDSLYDTNLEYRVAVEQMKETDCLSKTHRMPAGYKSAQLFTQVDMPKIMKIVNTVAEVFEKDLSQFFMEEDIQMQPDYRRWKNCRRKARREAAAEDEAKQDQLILKKRATLLAINEQLNTVSTPHLVRQVDTEPGTAPRAE